MKGNLYLLFFILILNGCRSGTPDNIKLLSDSPETLLPIEYFNSIQEDIRVEFIYTKRLDLQKLDQQKYDLLISRNLSSPVFLEKLAIPPNQEKFADKYYPALTSPYLLRKSPVLIPLSFDLPLIIYRDDQFSDPPPFTISFEELDELSTLPATDEALSQMPFSPLWDGRYLRARLLFSGEDFQEQGKFNYDQEKLSLFMADQREWLMENQGEKALEFSRKYRYIPDIQLLNQGRLDFLYMELSEYLTQQESLSKALEFSYLSNSQKECLPLDVLYMAITSQGSNHRQMEQFIDTLLSKDFQKDFLLWKDSLREDSFGFMGGLSSLPEVNRYVLSDYYQQLSLRMIQAEQLHPTPSLPENWIDLAPDVIDKWLIHYLEGEETQELQNFYRQWDLHYIP
ncbi:MAG: hypothetical protein PF447_05965 [Spirochaetaceae bacterium]|jgi:hypothetical protein|nr:hypothetical protein [Spirochaetaceae bacterium]